MIRIFCAFLRALLFPVHFLVRIMQFVYDVSLDLAARLKAQFGFRRPEVSHLEQRQWNYMMARKRRIDGAQSAKRIRKKRKLLRDPAKKTNEANRVKHYSRGHVLQHLAEMNRKSETQRSNLVQT